MAVVGLLIASKCTFHRALASVGLPFMWVTGERFRTSHFLDAQVNSATDVELSCCCITDVIRTHNWRIQQCALSHFLHDSR